MQSVVTEMVAELHAKAGCEQARPDTRDPFRQSSVKLVLSTAHRQRARRALFLSLRIDELALARACAAGKNSAWEIFLTRYREKLYLSALRIAREDSAAREFADTLYADLYGTKTREGQRVSKLEFVQRAGIARGLASHCPRAGICQSLPPNQTAGKP